MHTLSQCFTIRPASSHTIPFAHESTVEIAHQIVDLLYDADKDWATMRKSLQAIFLANSWKPYLTWAIFVSLRRAIEDDRPMGSALRTIYRRMLATSASTENFMNDRSTQRAIIALGILISTVPWSLETLGFTPGGCSECMSWFST